MTLVFICSYLNVSCVIDTIEHEGGDFRVLTADEGLLKLFSELYGTDHVIKLPIIFDSFSIKNILTYLVELPTYKKDIIGTIEVLKPSKIVFFYLGWNGFESWLIKRLSSTTEVFYRPKVDVEFVEHNYEIKNFIKTIICSFIFRIRFESSVFHGYPMITIGKSFLRLVNAKKYEHCFDVKHLKMAVEAKFDEYKDIKVLLLVGGEYDLDRETYKRKMSEVYFLLRKYYKPHQIGIKNHPNFPKLNFDWVSESIDIRKYIPANLLLYKNVNVVIAYSSGMIYESADLGCLSISTIDFIPCALKGKAESGKKYMLENSVSKDIFFPRAINEIEDMFKKNAVK